MSHYENHSDLGYIESELDHSHERNWWWWNESEVGDGCMKHHISSRGRFSQDGLVWINMLTFMWMAGLAGFVSYKVLFG